MLQAVIREHHIHRALIDQHVQRPLAVSAYHDRRTQRTPDQQRLIAHDRRSIDFSDAVGFGAVLTAITTADYTHAIALLCQPCSKTNEYRGLTRATGGQAADHNDGNAVGGTAFGRRLLATAMNRPPHRPGQGNETPGQEAVAIPDVIQQALKYALGSAHEAEKPCW